MTRIGIVEVEGILTLYENFGYLPTDILGSDGRVEDGSKAHKVLDGVIIPGGTLLESQTMTPRLAEEINLINDDDGFIFGMCAGFQVLAKSTDVGRNSPVEIIREGLGLLDVTFKPKINTNRVNVEVVDDTTLFTRGLMNETLTGFHCHTYGEINSNDKNVIYSNIERSNYKFKPERVLSGVSNSRGNILGTTLHGMLDNNPAVVNNILEYLDATGEYEDIKRRNKKLHDKVFSEIGVNTGSFAPLKSGHPATPPMIMLMATGSESGKTFLSGGIVGALRERGIHTYVIKVGPDIRDLSPSLYLNREKLEDFASVKISTIGWKPIEDIIEDVKGRGYDLILVEGVMSAFTGLLNEKTPYSASEVAHAADIPVIMVSSVSKGGIETAAVDVAAHIELLEKMDIDTRGVILNNVYDPEIFEHTRDFLSARTGIAGSEIWSVSKAKFEKKGQNPEDYLQLEKFTKAAVDVVKRDLDVDKIYRMAKVPEFRGYLSYDEICDIYKR